MSFRLNSSISSLCAPPLFAPLLAPPAIDLSTEFFSATRFWWEASEYGSHEGLLRFDSVQHLMATLRDFDVDVTKEEMRRVQGEKVAESLEFWRYSFGHHLQMVSQRRN